MEKWDCGELPYPGFKRKTNKSPVDEILDMAFLTDQELEILQRIIPRKIKPL